MGSNFTITWTVADGISDRYVMLGREITGRQQVSAATAEFIRKHFDCLYYEMSVAPPAECDLSMLIDGDGE